MDLGQRRLTSRHVAVPTRIIAPTYVRQLLTQANIALKRANRSGDPKKSLRVATMNRRLTQLNQMLNEINDLRPNAKNASAKIAPLPDNFDKTKSRHKRGWFDLGGKALHAVLGVATSEEVTLVQESVANLTSKVQVTSEALQIEIDSTKASLSELTGILKSTLKEIEGSLSRTWNSFQWHQEMNAISDMMDMAHTAMTEFLQLHHLLLSRKFNSPTKLRVIREAMIAAKATLPSDEVLFDHDRTLTWTELTKFVRLTETNDYSVFTVLVPATFKTPFDVMQVIPLPQKTDRFWAIISNAAPYVGLSSRGAFESKVLHCNSIFCHHRDELQILTKKVNTCSIQLIRPLTNTSACKLTYLDPTPTKVFPLPDHWVVSLLEESSLTIVCPSRTTEYPASVGNFLIPRTCDVYSTSLELRGTRKPLRTHTLEKAIKHSFKPFTEIPFTRFKSQQQFETLSNSLDELQEHLSRNVSTIANNHRFLAVTTHLTLGLGGSTAILLCLAIAMAIHIYRRYQAKKQKHTLQREQEARMSRILKRDGTL